MTERKMKGRKAQQPSILLLALIFLVTLVGLAVIVLLANADLLSTIERHNENRMAILVATRITGAPNFVMDTGYLGLHKNVLDTRRLDIYSKSFMRSLSNYANSGGATNLLPQTPYELRSSCYSWIAVIRNPQEDRLWVFGEYEILQEPLKTEIREAALDAYASKRNYYAGAGSTSYSRAQQMNTMLESMGGYTIPVTIALYEGDQIKKFDLGTLQVFVRKTPACTDSDKQEEEYIKAMTLVEKYYDFPQVSRSFRNTPLPHIPRFDHSGGAGRYLRCEELPIEEISKHFTFEEAELVAGMTSLTERIESAGEASGVDQNFLRAVLFHETGLDPEILAYTDIEAMAGSIRQEADYFADKVSASQCAPNYVAISRLVGPTETDEYITGTLAPLPETRRSAERIIYYYTAFSSCFGVEGR